LLSDEHFTVDGTLIEAWASRRSFVEKARPAAGRGHGRRRGRKLLRDTHEIERTDSEARFVPAEPGGGNHGPAIWDT